MTERVVGRDHRGQHSPERSAEHLVEDDAVHFFERAPCGYLSTTPDGRIVKANPTFAAWTGYDAAELTAMSFADLLSVGGRIYHETHYAPMLRLQGAVREIALEVVRKDGGRLPVLVNARLDRDAAHRPLIVRVVLLDATERRTYERELVRAREQAEGSERRARALVETLQQTLLPPELPAIPGLCAAAAYRPAGDGAEVGGDFYDLFPVAEDEWMAVLGDVSGKGAEAAVVTALVRHTIRGLAVTVPRPSLLLLKLDEVVRRHPTDRFCTVVVVRLRREGERWIATVSSGGHPPPILVRAGRPPAQLTVLGHLVGIVPSPRFDDVVVHLDPGDALLLHTDGITEGRGVDGYYGDDRMLEILARRGGGSDPARLADELVGALLEDVLAFQSQAPRDDIALLALAVPTDPTTGDGGG